ncbi:MAG: AraC family transcriptional regulator [Rhodanobacter sp.]
METDIAARCGFTSVQYLYTVFRRELGCTPKAYLQRQQEESMVSTGDLSTHSRLDVPGWG